MSFYPESEYNRSNTPTVDRPTSPDLRDDYLKNKKLPKTPTMRKSMFGGHTGIESRDESPNKKVGFLYDFDPGSGKEAYTSIILNIAKTLIPYTDKDISSESKKLLAIPLSNTKCYDKISSLLKDSSVTMGKGEYLLGYIPQSFLYELYNDKDQLELASTTLSPYFNSLKQVVSENDMMVTFNYAKDETRCLFHFLRSKDIIACFESMCFHNNQIAYRGDYILMTPEAFISMTLRKIFDNRCYSGGFKLEVLHQFDKRFSDYEFEDATAKSLFNRVFLSKKFSDVIHKDLKPIFKTTIEQFKLRISTCQANSLYW